MKYLQLTVLLFSTALLAGCLTDEDLEVIEGTSSSSGSSSSGSVLNYGGYSYTYSCTNIAYYYEDITTTIPPTVSSSCERTYKDFAGLSCNDFTSSHYDATVSAYYSCLQQEIAACETASLSDPNCY